MTLTVEQTVCYGKKVDGSPLPYNAEITKKTFSSKGINYLLEQKKTDTGVTTKLYRVGDNAKKFLLREKLNNNNFILRDNYNFLTGEKVSVSSMPKNEHGEFYFYDVKNGEWNKKWLSGYLSEGKVFSLNGFSVIDGKEKLSFSKLGGGSKYMFDKVLKYLLKVKI